MGRRIWQMVPGSTPSEPKWPHGPYVVMGFRQFCPADPPGASQKRKKHLVQVFTDPGGLRTLSVGSLRMRDPGKTGEFQRPPQRTSGVEPIEGDDD